MHLFYSDHIEIPVHPLDEEESSHIVRVLRLKEGDTVFLTDGMGNMHRCTIVAAVARRCQVRILSTETTPPNPFRIHIAIAPTKNINRLECFLEKATEIGIDVITPLICAHSERLNVKTDRLTKILIAAMKQSWKSRLPELQDPVRFNDLIHQDFPGQKCIAHCEAGEEKLLQKVYKPGSSALILIGPEGDFSPEEVSQAKQAGFIPVSLGKSRLRTETAGIVACCMVAVRNS
ncbi:MAG: 16S rRNA (uracil(1498)-N(3))-methyltransferase [bacterium]